MDLIQIKYIFINKQNKLGYTSANTSYLMLFIYCIRRKISYLSFIQAFLNDSQATFNFSI